MGDPKKLKLLSEDEGQEILQEQKRVQKLKEKIRDKHVTEGFDPIQNQQDDSASASVDSNSNSKNNSNSNNNNNSKSVGKELNKFAAEFVPSSNFNKDAQEFVPMNQQINF